MQLVPFEESTLSGGKELPNEPLIKLNGDWEIDPADLDFGDKTKSKLGALAHVLDRQALFCFTLPIWHGTHGGESRSPRGRLHECRSATGKTNRIALLSLLPFIS